jgi:hypothetical protein
LYINRHKCTGGRLSSWLDSVWYTPVFLVAVNRKVEVEAGSYEYEDKYRRKCLLGRLCYTRSAFKRTHEGIGDNKEPKHAFVKLGCQRLDVVVSTPMMSPRTLRKTDSEPR